MCVPTNMYVHKASTRSYVHSCSSNDYVSNLPARTLSWMPLGRQAVAVFFHVHWCEQCMHDSLSEEPPQCLSVSLSLCLAVSLSLCFSVSLSLCLPISLSLCLSFTRTAIWEALQAWNPPKKSQKESFVGSFREQQSPPQKRFLTSPPMMSSPPMWRCPVIWLKRNGRRPYQSPFWGIQKWFWRAHSVVRFPSPLPKIAEYILPALFAVAQFSHTMNEAKSWRRACPWFSDVKCPLSLEPCKVPTP